MLGFHRLNLIWSVSFLVAFFCIEISAIPVFSDEMTASKAEQVGKEIRSRWPAERPIDETSLKESGIRRIDGKHLVLYTDLPKGKRVDELPAIFDHLIPFLCDYFELDPKNYESFRLEGFLIDDFEKFKKGGAVRQVPALRNGYALRQRIWLRNQTSDYYLRHLLLHEGVHAFMGYAFGAWGPPWYREGTAELLATHHWEDGKLTLGYYPEAKETVPGWGRIEYVRKDFDRNKGRNPQAVFELGPEDYDENEAYAWSWAFAAFCEHHPRYKTAFRQTAWNLTLEPAKLSDRFLEIVAEEAAREKNSNDVPDTAEMLRVMENDWFDFLFNADYGYDFQRTLINYGEPGKEIPPEGIKGIAVQTDRGWQNGGVRLEKGKTYRFLASGRFQLADKPKIWWSEPNGITIRYYRKAPIGILLATLVPDEEISDDEVRGEFGIGFLWPRILGKEAVWTPKVSGTLYFRINDFSSELDDNRGTATIEIVPVHEFKESKAP